MQDSCFECVHFLPDKLDADYGECRRYPPPAGGRHKQRITWCGEFSPIEEDEPDDKKAAMPVVVTRATVTKPAAAKAKSVSEPTKDKAVSAKI